MCSTHLHSAGALEKKINDNNQRVVININGTLFETREKTLQHYPETLLGNIVERKKYLDANLNQYQFKRHAKSFEAILFFYQSTGILYRPPEVKLNNFLEECHFFQIPAEHIFYLKTKEGAILLENIERSLKPKFYRNITFSDKIWNFLENPNTSVLGRRYSLFSSFLIVTSFVLYLFETIGVYEVYDDNWSYFNQWLIVDLVLHVWFLIELSTRLIFSPDKTVFLKSPLNIIDILVIFTFFSTFFMNAELHHSPSYSTVDVRPLRVLRLLRLSKHSTQMKAVGLIIKDSLKDLKLFFVCFLIIIVFAGNVIYFLENPVEGSQFTSVPESMWWSVQTFLTLGYGDIVPVTIAGKLLSSLYMALGCATISLPVLSLIMKFSAYSQQYKT